MGTVTKRFDTGLANRPFLVLTFGLGHPGAHFRVECQNAQKSKTENGRLASLEYRIPEIVQLFWEH